MQNREAEFTRHPGAIIEIGRSRVPDCFNLDALVNFFTPNRECRHIDDAAAIGSNTDRRE
jgi:hypothetical protein